MSQEFRRSRRTAALKAGSGGLNNTSLGPADVLVGRGKGAYMSEGNCRYMQVVASFLHLYQKATANEDKKRITKEIVSHVKARGGRFMGVDDRGNLHVVSDHVARIKVGQAIRRLRRQRVGESKGGRSDSTSERTIHQIAIQQDESYRSSGTTTVGQFQQSERTNGEYASNWSHDGISNQSEGVSCQSSVEQVDNHSPYVRRPSVTALEASEVSCTSNEEPSFHSERTLCKSIRELGGNPSTYISKGIDMTGVVCNRDPQIALAKQSINPLFLFKNSMTGPLFPNLKATNEDPQITNATSSLLTKHKLEQNHYITCQPQRTKASGEDLPHVPEGALENTVVVPEPTPIAPGHVHTKQSVGANSTSLPAHIKAAVCLLAEERTNCVDPHLNASLLDHHAPKLSG